MRAVQLFTFVIFALLLGMHLLLPTCQVNDLADAIRKKDFSLANSLLMQHTTQFELSGEKNGVFNDICIDDSYWFSVDDPISVVVHTSWRGYLYGERRLYIRTDRSWLEFTTTTYGSKFSGVWQD
ncbi:hypothetical protein JYT83_00765 [bacterium AH-315-F18]|nr:hypothetical protein [bacterium AH-315-F18]